MLLLRINLKPPTLHQQRLCAELLCPGRPNVSFTIILLRISALHTHSKRDFSNSRFKVWLGTPFSMITSHPAYIPTTAFIIVYSSYSYIIS